MEHWLEVAGCTGPMLERVLATLRAEDVTSLELLRIAWEDVSPAIRAAPRALIRRALQAEQGTASQSRRSTANGEDLDGSSADLSGTALWTNVFEFSPENIAQANVAAAGKSLNLVSSYDPRRRKRGDKVDPGSAEMSSSMHRLAVFEWRPMVTAELRDKPPSSIEHEVHWRELIDFLVCRGSTLESAPAAASDLVKAKATLPTLVARDVRKLDPEQQRHTASSQPLLLMRHGSILCSIPVHGVYCVLQRGRLYFLSTTQSQDSAKHGATKEMVEDIAVWQLAHAKSWDSVQTRGLTFEYFAIESVFSHVCQWLHNQTQALADAVDEEHVAQSEHPGDSMTEAHTLMMREVRSSVNELRMSAEGIVEQMKSLIESDDDIDNLADVLRCPPPLRGEVEAMVEHHVHDATAAVAEMDAVMETISAAEKSLSYRQDAARNRLLRFDIAATSVGSAMSVGGVVSGIFGSAAEKLSVCHWSAKGSFDHSSRRSAVTRSRSCFERSRNASVAAEPQPVISPERRAMANAEM